MYVSCHEEFELELTPSLSIAPLLIEMMACGAMYLSEPLPAAKMHAVTLQLSLQVRFSSGSMHVKGW